MIPDSRHLLPPVIIMLIAFPRSHILMHAFHCVSCSPSLVVALLSSLNVALGVVANRDMLFNGRLYDLYDL